MSNMERRYNEGETGETKGARTEERKDRSEGRLRFVCCVLASSSAETCDVQADRTK